MNENKLYYEYLIEIIKNPIKIYPCIGKCSLYIGEIKNKGMAFVIAEKVEDKITLIGDYGWME